MRLVFSLLLLASCVCAEAADRYQLVRVVLHGSKRYSEADLLSASGLKIGTQVTAADLQNAAGKLNSTGVFSTVQYLFKPASGAINGVEADFELTDAPKFLPAKFDNFLWFSPEDIFNGLHNALPLYNGELPMTGSLADDVSAALSALLAARKLPSEVSYMLEGEKNQPPREYLFKVEHAGLKVAAFHFAGAARMDSAALAEAVTPLKDTDFLYSIVDSWVTSKIITLYHQNGYLHATVGVKPQLGENSAVTVNVAIEEGTQYRIAGFSWTGSTAISGDELAKHLTLKEGEPANSVKLEIELSRMRRLFGKFGFEAARIRAVPAFSGESVRYTVEITEGAIYHMGKLEVVAPEPYRQKVLDLWKLKEGAVYDNTYLQQTADQMKKLVPGGGRWEWKAREQIDDAARVVNVNLEVATK